MRRLVRTRARKLAVALLFAGFVLVAYPASTEARPVAVARRVTVVHPATAAVPADTVDCKDDGSLTQDFLNLLSDIGDFLSGNSDDNEPDKVDSIEFDTAGKPQWFVSEVKKGNCWLALRTVQPPCPANAASYHSQAGLIPEDCWGTY